MQSGYAPVNGIRMYYEIHGEGMPLVLIHGGGSTIQTSFGRVLDAFSKNRKVIALELQEHGRTEGREGPETFEQDADDVAALLKYLGVDHADFLGFSNGGNTAMQIAARHPSLVRKLILVSSFFKRSGMYPQLWESLPKATLNDMPPLLAEAYKKVAPDPGKLISMFERDRTRMVEFKDWDASLIQSIKVPVFIITNDADVVMPEHAVEMFRLFPNARLAILPGLHGASLGEITTGMDASNIPQLTVEMTEAFLNEAVPFAP
jgi:pimeloyl-ACP methyl ester carboxylesterase